MLIFVYEFLCAGGLSGATTSASLYREGLAMLDAVLGDLGRCPGVQTVTLLDLRVRPSLPVWPHNRAVLVEPGEEAARFVELARQADFSLVIAPEFDEHLLKRCQWVENSGGRLLGPGVDAVRLCGDKLRLAEHLQSRNVSTPSALLWSWGDAVPSYPAVVKPRFGAGSQATFLVRNEEECARAADQAEEEGWHGAMIVQPFCEGFAASVAFLIGHENTIALPAAAQHLSTDGRFRYQGGSLPLAADLNERAQRLGRQAIASVDGLFGYVGVDLILGVASDGHDDKVIEINPRLTTSYVGLRHLARFNLAEALLAIAEGTPLPHLEWHNASISFGADEN